VKLRLLVAIAEIAVMAVALLTIWIGGTWLWGALVLMLAMAVASGLARERGATSSSTGPRHADRLAIYALVLAVSALLIQCVPPFWSQGKVAGCWLKIPIPRAIGAAVLLAAAALVKGLLSGKHRRRVTVSVTTLAISVAVLMLRPLYTEDRVNARLQICREHMASIAQALLMYAADNGDTLPPSENWQSLLSTYIDDPQTYTCPDARNQECSYAFNAAVAGRKLSSLDTTHPVVFVLESDRGGNAAGGPELLPATPRHLHSDDYGFADGHARPVARETAPHTIWESSGWK